jgi:hypothetical protein
MENKLATKVPALKNQLENEILEKITGISHYRGKGKRNDPDYQKGQKDWLFDRRIKRDRHGNISEGDVEPGIVTGIDNLINLRNEAEHGKEMTYADYMGIFGLMAKVIHSFSNCPIPKEIDDILNNNVVATAETSNVEKAEAKTEALMLDETFTEESNKTSLEIKERISEGSKLTDKDKRKFLDEIYFIGQPSGKINILNLLEKSDDLVEKRKRKYNYDFCNCCEKYNIPNIDSLYNDLDVIWDQITDDDSFSKYERYVKKTRDYAASLGDGINKIPAPDMDVIQPQRCKTCYYYKNNMVEYCKNRNFPDFGDREACTLYKP